MYFMTDIYVRTLPVSMMDKMSAQIDQLRHVELLIHPFDDAFKRRHREAVLYHCKMALAYLDSREARISMKLCEQCAPATQSSESRIQRDPNVDFSFLRITMLSVMACAARRVKFYQKAVDALSKAKDLCLSEGENMTRVHPLMTALTFLNLSAVLGDIDHDSHGLVWGLKSLKIMYDLLNDNVLPEIVMAYYLILALHNAALLNMKLGNWADATDLVGEGIEFTKILDESDDGLRRKLIAIGAQAKHVPEGFLMEAVNALNGWGEERHSWNLSFWDFSANEILEEIYVLKRTTTLKQIIIEHFDEEPRHNSAVQDELLARLVLAIVGCGPLETITVSGIDFDPRKIWMRIRKPGFLETSWYAATLNFTNFLRTSRTEVADYKQLIKNVDSFSKKLILFMAILGNECEGIDLSENCIDGRSITAVVRALRWLGRPDWTRNVSTLILRSNDLNAETMGALAKTWDPTPDPPALGPYLKNKSNDYRSELLSGDSSQTYVEPSVTSLDVSYNSNIGDKGLDLLTSGIKKFNEFKVLHANGIGLHMPGCSAVESLQTTSLEILSLSNNAIGPGGAEVVTKAALQCQCLRTLELNDCSIDSSAAPSFSKLLQSHQSLENLSLNKNQLGSDGIMQLCVGAAEAKRLRSVHISYNEITSEDAAKALGSLMRRCRSLREMNLSGNHIESRGAPHIGSAIEHSKILTLNLSDMGFTELSIDNFLDNGNAETQDLQVMILNENPVGDEGLGIIAECLSIGLTDLSLSNCLLTAASQATLLNLVSLSPNLKSLDLSNNNLGPTGCSDMVTWMQQNEKESFSLRSLELANCGLGDDGFYALVPILGSLTYLGAKGNGITSAGLDAIMNSNQVVMKLKVLDLADNMIGEKGVHALTDRFQQEHKRSLWNPRQLTSSIDKVILTNNRIERSLAMSTEAYLKIHNPLLNVAW
jgi:Ran GTPase-activating protein (RanGAP) involved in mRNA processing and transport